MSDEFIGKTIGGYEVLSQIGKGGMATVYLARQTSMNRSVALKMLPRDMMKDDSYLARFRREVDIVAQLEHRNIVPVYDHDTYEGQPYIAMRYMKAGSLDSLLTNGALSMDRIVTILLQIAPALDYAHSKGVLHRDLKPSNILIDDDGGFYITDFGIARILNTENSGATLTTQGVLGTPSYMSPEQAQGQPLDSRSDVYALGVMLFEMATGRRPFYSDTPYSVAVMQVTAPPPSPRSINPKLTYEVEQVIYKALKKRPEERYQTAQDLAEALKMASESRGESLHDTQPHPLNVRAALSQATQEAKSIPSPPQPQPIYVQQQQYTPTPPAYTPQPSGAVAPISQPVRPRKTRRKASNLWTGVMIGGVIGCGLLAVIVVLMLLVVNMLLTSNNTGGASTPDATPAVSAVSEVVTAAPSTSDTTAIPTRSPTLAPISGSLSDGQVLYFAESETDGILTYQVYRGTLGSGQMLALTSGASNNMYPSAAPSGQHIVFQSDRGRDFDLYRINSVGGEIRALTDTPYDELFPAWSPDGEWIAFSADIRGDGTYDLYRIRPDGSDLEALLTDRDARSSQPRWSPDSSKLVFTHGAPRDASTWDLWVLDVESDALTQLTDNTTREAWAVFSPDGQTIAFVSGNDGTTAVSVISASGGEPRVIHSANDFVWGLAYTPDGQQLIFNAGSITSANGAIYAINADGGTRQSTNITNGHHIIWTR